MQGLWGGAVVAKFGFRWILMLTLKASPRQTLSGGRLHLLLYDCNKSIASTIDGLDDPWPPPTIPSHLAKPRQASAQAPLPYVGLRPEMLDKLRLRNNPVAMPHEVDQQVERLWL
jgi:hypothetical protein